MKRLSDIPEEVDDEFQCIGTRLACIAIGQTSSKDLSVIRNSRDDTASRPTIALEIHRTAIGWTNVRT